MAFGKEIAEQLSALSVSVESLSLVDNTNKYSAVQKFKEKVLDDLPDALMQGNCETVVCIGADFGCRESDFATVLALLTGKSREIDCECTLLHKNYDAASDAVVAYFLVRKRFEAVLDFIELRVAALGNVDAGKSTILGVLTKGDLDDGRGRARVDLFRHKHEIETGRTSSVGHEIMCFDAGGKFLPSYGAINNTSGTRAYRRLPSDTLSLSSSKIVSFLDLAGHEKYLKTTMFGLTGYLPNYVMLMVGANAGLVGMTKEHLSLSFALNIPAVVVVTKIDMCPAPVLEETLRQITKLLRSNACKRTPLIVRTLSDMLPMLKNIVDDRICPIFQVSNVSGEGIDLLRCFLNYLPVHCHYNVEHAAEFEISETFSVAGVGTVVAGTLVKGRISVNQSVVLGPLSNGSFVQTLVKGIQRKRSDVNQIAAGQYGSLALKKIKRNAIRKGMVILDKEHPSLRALPEAPDQAAAAASSAKCCSEFEAEVLVLFHSSTLCVNYQAMLHCGVVRQAARIVALPTPYLRTGDRAVVRFGFLKQPEFLRVGSRLLFREGRTKGVGKIIKLFD